MPGVTILKGKDDILIGAPKELPKASAVLRTSNIFSMRHVRLVISTANGDIKAIGCGKEWNITSPIVAKNQEHTKAVYVILNSRDLVTAIRGPTAFIVLSHRLGIIY